VAPPHQPRASQRPRDTQRSRVYRAETGLSSSPLPGLEACHRFAQRVVGTLWWHARFPDHTLAALPRLRPGNGARQAFYREEEDGTATITLPRRYRTKGVVLHELAHWGLADEEGLAHHGPGFTRLLLDAIEEFCGPDRAAELAAAYREHRVRVSEGAILDGDRLRYGDDERRRLAAARR